MDEDTVIAVWQTSSNSFDLFFHTHVNSMHQTNVAINKGREKRGGWAASSVQSLGTVLLNVFQKTWDIKAVPEKLHVTWSGRDCLMHVRGGGKNGKAAVTSPGGVRIQRTEAETEPAEY